MKINSMHTCPIPSVGGINCH